MKLYVKQVSVTCAFGGCFFLKCVLFHRYKTQHNTELAGLCNYMDFDLFPHSDT